MTISLTTAARYTNGFDLAFSGAVGGETTFQLEMNRAGDFSIDDSLFATYAGSPVAIRGIPSGTPWYMRMRSTSLPSGPSAWSNVELAATGDVPLLDTYAGFAIDKAMLAVPEAVANLAAVATAGAAIPGYPVTHLLRDDPTSTFRWGAGAFRIEFDTAGVPIDTIALLGSLANDDATWRIRADELPANRGNGANYDSGVIPFRCSPSLGRRRAYHALQVLPAPTTARAWRIDVTTTAPQFLARNLVVGLARRSVNASRGAGASANDQGSATRTRYGVIDRVLGWRGRLLDFELSWMREREYQAKWADLPARVGKTSPVLAIPNSKRNVWLNDRIGYGPITNMRAENVQSFYHSQTIEIDSIY